MKEIFLNTWIPLILFMVGIVLITLSLFSLTSRKVSLKKRTTNEKAGGFRNSIYNKMEEINFISKLVDKFQYIYGYFTSESELNNRIKAKKFIINIIFVNMVVIGAIILLPMSTLIKVITYIIILLGQYMFINSNIKTKKQKLRDGFHILVREFIEGYAIKKEVKYAFEYAVKELNPIYQVHVNRLIVQLSSVTAAEKAFSLFNKRVDYHMCSVFLSLVQSAYSSNKNINENLLMLQDMINQERKETKENKRKIKNAANGNIFWILCCLVEIVGVGYACKTSTGNYFLTTSLGQTLFISTLAACVLSFVGIKMADSI